MYNRRSQLSRRPVGRTVREDGTRRSSPGNTNLVIIIFSGITATEYTVMYRHMGLYSKYARQYGRVIIL